MPSFRPFTWKDSNFRVRSTAFRVITDEIRAQRGLLEAYIDRHPAFRTSLIPLPLLADAPEIARRMARAASATGVGPMAAVAGTIAAFAVEAALRSGAEEAVVDNGGDVVAVSGEPLLVGLYAGRSPVGGRLAFRLEPGEMPVAVCSSSSRMGHSLSFGDCDLATVVAADASLADAAATLAANLVRTAADIDAALERVGGIRGIRGVLLVKDERVGLIGHLPALVRNRDPSGTAKVTRDRRGVLPE